MRLKGILDYMWVLNAQRKLSKFVKVIFKVKLCYLLVVRQEYQNLPLSEVNMSECPFSRSLAGATLCPHPPPKHHRWASGHRLGPLPSHINPGPRLPQHPRGGRCPGWTGVTSLLPPGRPQPTTPWAWLTRPSPSRTSSRPSPSTCAWLPSASCSPSPLLSGSLGCPMILPG